MKFTRLTIHAGILFAISSPVYAQCDDILKDGTLQVTNYRSSELFELAMHNEFLSSNFSASKSTTSAGLSVPIGEYIMGSGNYSADDFRRKQAQIRKVLRSSLRNAKTIDFARASGDSTIANAWVTCMGQSGGFLSVNFQRPSVEDALITFEWHSGKSTLDSTKILDDIYVGGFQVLQGKRCLKKGLILKNGRPCQTRIKLPNAEADMLVSASSTNGSSSAYLPPKLKIVRQEKVFQFLKGECASNPPTDFRNVASWGKRCPHRLTGSAKRQSLDFNKALYLSEDLAAEGWVFDTTSFNMTLSRHRGTGKNRCANPKVTKANQQINYGYRAEGRGNSNVTVICSVLPAVNLERYKLVPAL